jgi:type 1 fimbria pilin
LRTSRRPTAAAGFALGLATVTMVTSGCSLASPVAEANYPASDGANVALGDVRLSNFLVVAEGKGKPGVVVGAVSTEGAKPVQVRITVLNGQTSLGETTVTAEPGNLANLASGEGASVFQLSDVPVQPGANLTLRASTDGGGQDVTLPVLPATDQYESIKPSATQAPVS